MENQIKKYVAGFMFLQRAPGNEILEVALIKKKRPEWQAGLLNAIGGKIETRETPLHAMRREFLEETGVAHHDWEEFVELRGPTDYDPECWGVHFFKTFVPQHIYDRRETRTDEQLCSFSVNAILCHRAHDVIVPNLNWLVPMALGLPFNTLP